MCDTLPILDGKWRINGLYLQYENKESTVDLCNPTVFEPVTVTIKQKGRFFTYATSDNSRQPKLGVLEKVYFGGCFYGWKGHMVDTLDDNENYLFNFTKLKGNLVTKLEITYTESGYDPGNPQQKPRVEYATGKRIRQKC